MSDLWEYLTPKGIVGKSPGADGAGGGSKKTPAMKNTPPPLPPPTRPDEQLFWLDLTIDKKWDLKLNRPFDRAIADEASLSTKTLILEKRNS